MKRQTATVDCPKSMVGRVIGKNGETIKALQTYTGALIQIDQTVEPTKVTISGTPHSLSLAVSMVTDIVKGTFKGFALLRQITNPGAAPRVAGLPNTMAQPRPVYAPGYGLIPPSQLYGADDRTAGVVSVDYAGRRTQAALGYMPGQVTPSQVILGLQPGSVIRPMGQAGGMMGPGMGQLQPGEDMMAPMAGYAPGAMAYAYPPEYAAMQGMPGVMPPDMMYGDPMGGMGPQGAVGANARLYGAAAGSDKRPGGNGNVNGGGNGGGGGRSGGAPAKSSSAPDVSEMMDGNQQMGMGGPMGGPGHPMGHPGNWVQVMDPEGKVYFYNQGQQ